MKATKRTSIIAFAFALIAAMAVFVGTASPALAAEGDNGAWSPGAANLTKNFTMPEAVATPNETFTYTFVPVSVNDDTVAAGDVQTTTIMPRQFERTLTNDGSDADSVVTTTVANGTRTVQINKTMSKILPDIGTTAGFTFTHAGVYVYTVTETLTNPATNITSSQAKYTVSVFVDNDGTGGLAFTGVSVKETLKDDGTTGSGNKVNPSSTAVGTYATPYGFEFTNNYHVLTNLAISKAVANANATYGDTTRAFPFTLTLATPATNLLKSTTLYARVFESTGTGTSTYVAVATDANGAVTTPVQFNLKHGQYLAFVDGNPAVDPAKTGVKADVLPVGTTYSVVESLGGDTGLINYTPSATYQFSNGTAAATPNTVADGAAGANYTINKAVSETVAVQNSTTLGEGVNNKVDVTNTYKPVSPTGILISNLPFIIMILVAVGGIVLYVVSRRRRHDRLQVQER